MVSRQPQKALYAHHRLFTGLGPSGLTPSSVLECGLISYRDEVATYVPRGVTPLRSYPPFRAAWTADMAFRNFSRPTPFAGSTSGKVGLVFVSECGTLHAGLAGVGPHLPPSVEERGQVGIVRVRDGRGCWLPS
jgi:hypothetical protein